MIKLGTQDYQVVQIILSAIKVSIFKYNESGDIDSKDVAVNNLLQLSYLLLKKATAYLVNDDCKYKDIVDRHKTVSSLAGWVLPRVKNLDEELHTSLKRDFDNITRWTKVGLSISSAQIGSVQKAYTDIDKFVARCYTTW